MKNKFRILPAILLSISMMLLILDSKSYISGAQEGIKLCLYTVIPSLFPFFIIGNMLTNRLFGKENPLISRILKPLNLPNGSSSLYILGLISGYPVGAQCVHRVWRDGKLQTEDAQRLIGICNNAGPGFIFGMTGLLFSDPLIPWLLWIIQIISSYIAGWVFSGKALSDSTLKPAKPVTITQALQNALRSMAVVCGWVILFRIMIYMGNRWVFWIFSDRVQRIITAFLELSNGCLDLSKESNELYRFVICSGMLSWGGVCVAMQTVSVCNGLSARFYFVEKIVQTTVSLLLSYSIYMMIYLHSPIQIILLAIIIVVYSLFRKISSRNFIKACV